MKDHFSKFCWAFPLTSKKCDEVAIHLRQVFLQFGPPKILQSDNGGEFVGKAVQDLLLEFPNTRHIKSRPRHPQTQGLIERANQTLETKIAAVLLENPVEGSWAHHLARILFDINTSFSATIGSTPFELMFNRKPLPMTAIPIPTEERIDIDEGEMEVNTEQADKVGLSIDKATDASCSSKLGVTQLDSLQSGSLPSSKPTGRIPDCWQSAFPQTSEVLGPFRNLLFSEDNAVSENSVEEPTQRDDIYVLFDPEDCVALCLAIKIQSNSVTCISGEAAFQILECFERKGQGRFLHQPISVGNVLQWPSSQATNGLGNTIDSIKARIPAFELTLRRRKGPIREIPSESCIRE